jgi:hypothetical protein
MGLIIAIVSMIFGSYMEENDVLLACKQAKSYKFSSIIAKDTIIQCKVKEVK